MSRLTILILALGTVAAIVSGVYVLKPALENLQHTKEVVETHPPTVAQNPEKPQLLFNAGILTSEFTGYTMRYIGDLDGAKARPVELPDFIQPFAQEVKEISPGQSHIMRYSSDGLWVAPVNNPTNLNLLVHYPDTQDGTWIPRDFHWSEYGSYVAYELRGQDYSEFFIVPITGGTPELIARYSFSGKDRYSRNFEGIDMDRKYVYLYEENEIGEITIIKMAWHTNKIENIVTLAPEDIWVFEPTTETVYVLDESSFQQMDMNGSRTFIASTNEIDPEMTVKYTHMYTTPNHSKLLFVVIRENNDSYLMFFDKRTNSFDRFLANEAFADYVLSYFDPISYDDRYVMLQKDDTLDEESVREFCIVDLETKTIISLYQCSVADRALDYHLNTDGLVFYAWVHPASTLASLPEATVFPEPYDWREQR